MKIEFIIEIYNMRYAFNFTCSVIIIRINIYTWRIEMYSYSWGGFSHINIH